MTRCSCNFVYHYSTYLNQQMPLHMCQISFSFETKTLIDPLFLMREIRWPYAPVAFCVRELCNKAQQQTCRANSPQSLVTFVHLCHAEVSGGRVRGRPRLGSMDGVKVALGNRGMTVEAARYSAEDRKERKPWYM